ncbi:PAS domain-containing protein [Hymenobacter sp. B81]|uniref:PAS domain-containing protein n=1 Tax=Hymenobacter sp. B81 TaxID=3344878 RepID=UPI0037DD76A2
MSTGSSSSPNPFLSHVLSAWRTVNGSLDDGEPAAAEQVPAHIWAALERDCFVFAYDVLRQPDGYLYLSPGVEKVLGVAAAELNMRRFYDRLHPDDAPLVSRASELALAFLAREGVSLAGLSYTVDFRLRHAHGHYVRVLRQNVVVETAPDGRIAVLAGVVTDISAHKTTGPVVAALSYPGFDAYLREQGWTGE